MRKSLVLVLTLIVALTLAACGSKNNNPGASGSAPADNGNNAALSGTITAAGSTALQPLVDQVSQKFMSDNSGVSITVQGGGSGGGLTQVAGGQVDIGNSDIFAEEKLKEEAKGLQDHQVAVVAITAVTHPQAGVDNLTKQQLVDIFSGKVTNWKDVGGVDQKIVIVNRPASSGTRKSFENLALGGPSKDLPGAIQEESSGTVKKLVAETPGAIGYLALSYLDDSVKAVKYDGTDPSVENVTSGKFPVWAYEHMYTKGEPTPLVKAFLDYMVSDALQNGDVKDMGYIPVGDMKVARDASGTVTNK
jgi:phosphate transport system substrate-binding protein